MIRLPYCLRLLAAHAAGLLLGVPFVILALQCDVFVSVVILFAWALLYIFVLIVFDVD